MIFITLYYLTSLREFLVAVISLRRSLASLESSASSFRARVPAALLPASNLAFSESNDCDVAMINCDVVIFIFP
jgi:hypothetical protein